MPEPRELIRTIEENASIATFRLGEAMADQGRRARISFLAIQDLSSAANMADQIVPDGFADELFEAAEDAFEDMATFSFDYAVTSLPDVFPVDTITEVGRRAAVNGVLDDVAAHMVAPNEIVRERVRKLIVDAAAKEHTVASVATEIEGVVGDLITKDGRFIPAHKRARTIARTETAWASGKAETKAWAELKLTHVEIYDGDGCGWSGHEDPDTANGLIVTLARYESQLLSHPNCVRTAAPVVKD